MPKMNRLRLLLTWLVGGLPGLLTCMHTGVASAAGNVTATQFAVTEGGAATLSIPLQVPRGVGGMEPQLTLNYSSGAGNGLLGVGWSLQGPSAITRCPQTMATDALRGSVNFNSGDRFCLDGQRLLLVNPADPNSTAPVNQANYGAGGTEYRTERDAFSRVTAIGQYSSQTNVPRGFKVETKSGLILDFGNVLDATEHTSQVMTNYSTWTTGLTSTISRWMLRRISDRHGSFVEFEYCKGEVTPAASAPIASTTSSCNTGAWAGSAPIHHIRYTNRGGAVNGTFGVVFRYEQRPDRVQTFHAGSSTRQTQRLSAVQTFVDFNGPGAPGTLVRSYEIIYQTLESGSASVRATNVSRIAQIRERGGDGATTLPPLTFTMEQDSVFGLNVTHRGSTTVSTPPAPRCGGVLYAKLQMCE